MEAARIQPARAGRPRQAEAATRTPERLGVAGGAAGVLALQRAAGNAVTGASLRMLARCGAGGCTCGGTCGGHRGGGEAEELELQRSAADRSGRQALARAVSARRGLA